MPGGKLLAAAARAARSSAVAREALRLDRHDGGSRMIGDRFERRLRVGGRCDLRRRLVSLPSFTRLCAQPKRVRSKPDAKTSPQRNATTIAAPKRAREYRWTYWT